jgi:DNA polymerase I
MMAGKVILEFYPIDVWYNDNKNEIVLFGTTKDGNKIVVIDRTFKPYFYCIIDETKKESVIQSLTKVAYTDGENVITPIRIVEEIKNMVGKRQFVVKVIAKSQREMKLLREQIRYIDGVLKIVEDDIKPERRYLIDKKYQMLTRLRVKGNELENSEYTGLTVIADEISVIGGEIPEIPKILAIDIETYNPIGNPRPTKDPIIMISFSSNFGLNKVVTWKKFENPDRYVEFVSSEHDLLEKFVDIIKKENPHIIVGYNSDNFDFPYILERAKRYKLELPLGADNSELKVIKRRNGHTSKIRGIPHVDLYLFIRNILSPTLKTESYDLNSVAKELIGEGKNNEFHWTEMSGVELPCNGGYNTPQVRTQFDEAFATGPESVRDTNFLVAKSFSDQIKGDDLRIVEIMDYLGRGSGLRGECPIARLPVGHRSATQKRH